MAKSYLIFLFIVSTVLSAFTNGGTVSCTFDSDLCGWHSVPSSKFRWRKGSGQTEDRTSGPLNDHTCANYKGKYVFISGGDAESNKAIAVLETDLFTLNGETALTFWYIMNGFGTGSLSLEVVNNDTTIDEVWRKEGRQSRDWTKETVKLKAGMMKLRMKATVRMPVGSDIAVDDIELASESQTKVIVQNNSHCEVTTTTSTTTTTTTTTPTVPTTTTAERMNKTHKASILTTVSSSDPSISSCAKFIGKTDILPGTCDFENGTCGIIITANKGNRGVTWVRTNKMDGNKYTNDSIKGDHTHEGSNTTNGVYLSFKNAWSFINSKLIASVETPAINASYVCFSFWYNVPAAYSNLDVLVRDYTGRLRSIWGMDNYIPEKRIPHLTGWHQQHLFITQDPPFTIVFQAYNNYHLARVGLDDIKVIGMHVNTGWTKSVTRETTTLTTTSELQTSGRTGTITRRTSPTTTTTKTVTSEKTGPVTKQTNPLKKTTKLMSSLATQTVPDKTSKKTMNTRPVTSLSFEAVTTKAVTSNEHTLVPISVKVATTTADRTSPGSRTTVTPNSKQPSSSPSTSTGHFETRTKPQDTTPCTTASCTPKSTAATRFVSHSTQKVEKKTTEKGGKKATSHTTKKTDKINVVKGDSEKQTDKDTYEKTSTIVGSAVGALLAIVLIAVVVYVIAHSKNKAKQKRRQQMNKKKANRQMNGGVSNAGYTSSTFLSTTISSEKPKSNGHLNTYEHFTVCSLNPVYTPSNEQINGHVTNGGPQVKLQESQVNEEERLTRL